MLTVEHRSFNPDASPASREKCYSSCSGSIQNARMTALGTTIPLTADACRQRASQRDGKQDHSIDGVLGEKVVGFECCSLPPASLNDSICAHTLHNGVAAVEVMTYCFDRSDHGRQTGRRFRADEPVCRMGKIPRGYLHIAPDLVVEVLSSGNTGIRGRREA